MKKAIAEFDVINHGVRHEDAFAGCGSAEYDDVATGIGASVAEAVRDALESLANNWDVEGMEKRICRQYNKRSIPGKLTVLKKHSLDCWQYISIRVSGPLDKSKGAS